MTDTRPGPHPPVDRLRAYASGRLSGPEADAVEEHVAGCRECVAALEAMPDDPLLELARLPSPDTDRPPRPEGGS